jgi:hypothetical protein
MEGIVESYDWFGGVWWSSRCFSIAFDACMPVMLHVVERNEVFEAWQLQSTRAYVHG